MFYFLIEFLGRVDYTCTIILKLHLHTLQGGLRTVKLKSREVKKKMSFSYKTCIILCIHNFLKPNIEII